MIFFENTRNYIKTNFNKLKFLAILVIFIFLIPLIINGLYQIPAPFPILHLGDSVSVVLEFYGNIFSAALGIWGVFISIRYAQKQSQEDYERNSRNSVIPCISVSPVNSHCSSTLFNTSLDESPGYIEEELNEIIFILEEDNSVLCKSHLSKREQDLYFLGKEDTKAGFNLIHPLNFPMVISNIGNGSIPFLKISLSSYDQCSDIKCHAPSIPLMKDNSKTIRICSKAAHNQKYILDFEYSDVLKNKYKDTYEIIIAVNQERTTILLSEPLSFQKLINQ